MTPGFEVGGTLFRPDQLAALGSIVGEDARIEMTTFKRLYVEMDAERVEEAKVKLEGCRTSGSSRRLCLQEPDHLQLCRGRRIRDWMLQRCWMKRSPIILYPIR